ncbi:MAG: hypothetical protein JWP69_32 [Flaviaesturariibacter sp.]|nr:hypothetical protein [Flaviaesturariibacter sp.]
MNEQDFLQVINDKANKLGINPFLLLSGIEGLYTFRDVPLNTINYDFLDSLILSIFALRIGDQFHTIAQENLISENDHIRDAAAYELQLMSDTEIAASGNPYLESFARILAGKSPLRRYHSKALEAAALEINATQLKFKSESISSLVLGICKSELSDSLDLGALFATQ